MAILLSNSEGLAGCDLLRGLVFWEKPNSEIEARMASVSATPTDFQTLALDLTGLTVPEETARVIFSALDVHVLDPCELVKRRVGVRAARSRPRLMNPFTSSAISTAGIVRPNPWHGIHPRGVSLSSCFWRLGSTNTNSLLNREKLTIDPDNPESVYDGYDGRNSVLRVSS